MDHADVTLSGVKAIKLDLRDKASIDAAVDECGGPIHALLSCAGAADGTPGIEKINFIGHRHLIDRALEKQLLPRGAAIGMISSAAGLAWESNLPLLKEYLATNKPVVVRKLPATEPWADCADVVDSPEAFASAVLTRLKEGVPEAQKQARVRLESESWSVKAEQFEKWVDGS